MKKMRRDSGLIGEKERGRDETWEEDEVILWGLNGMEVKRKDQVGEFF
jgi:hypothetical protein